MTIPIYQAGSLGEYYDCIDKISKKILNKREGKKENVPTIWFRAESSFDFALIPSLYRKKWKGAETFTVPGEKYSDLHYAEDIRIQHYNAKNYHYLKKDPSSRIELLEIMQHHGVKTRLLDWSESSTHSLLFALEVFFNDSAQNAHNRADINPCIWVLEPSEMNQKTFEYLGTRSDLLNELLDELELDSGLKNQIIQRIKCFCDMGTIKKYAQISETQHIDYLLNLSSICDDLTKSRHRIKSFLKNQELLHPLYYLLSRIYADGYLLRDYGLPPLAVVQPYHSERIRAQRGIFTVFPLYWSEGRAEKEDFCKMTKIIPEAMSFNEIAKGCLYKIILKSPQKIAYEILANGMNESWLYPEMPVVSNEIEVHRIY